jgi:hypothetical protein
MKRTQSVKLAMAILAIIAATGVTNHAHARALHIGLNHETLKEHLSRQVNIQEGLDVHRNGAHVKVFTLHQQRLPSG